MSRSARTPFVLLGLLIDGPKSGYELKTVIQQSVSHFWRESYGQLYPTLKALHGRELVSLSEESSGGRARKTYAITEAGTQEFFQWLARPPEPSPPRNEMLLKVFLASLGGPEDLRPHLLAAQERAEEQLATLRLLHAHVTSEPATDHQRRCWLLTLNLGIRGAEATIAWAESGLTELAEAA